MMRVPRGCSRRTRLIEIRDICWNPDGASQFVFTTVALNRLSKEKEGPLQQRWSMQV